MGAFVLCREPDAERAREAVRRLDGALSAQGFAAAERIEGTFGALALYPKLSGGPASLYRADDRSFCAAAGTVLYRGRTGPDAMAALLSDRRADAFDPEALFGSFCLLVFLDGRLELTTDRVGTYPVWHDRDFRIISSSFIAVADAADRLTVEPQSVFEYVFQGATYGGRTLFAEIGILDPTETIAVGPKLERRRRPAFEIDQRPDGPIQAHLDRNLANLRRYVSAIGNAFGDRADTALSGGYDSRLILALLREAGITPRIHVYGADGDADVTIAKEIAAGEGLALESIDKGAAPRVAPDAFADLVERNFHNFHAYPNDGLFDNGTDLETRREACEGGRVTLNGGGGEIFRNFFYLRDGRYGVRQLLWAFYSQYDPASGGPLFDEHCYLANLARKVRQTAGTERDTLTRTEIEAVYPLFRCRYWMGRNNAVNNRLGPALTPYIDANIVPAALRVPLRYKNHGVFESRLIAAIDARLAAYASVYGHGFDRDPPLSRRLKDYATYLRPTWLRRRTFRLQHRQRPQAPYWLTEEYVARVIDPSLPYMRRFFVPDAIRSLEQLNRLYTLEYVLARYRPCVPEIPHRSRPRSEPADAAMVA